MIVARAEEARCKHHSPAFTLAIYVHPREDSLFLLPLVPGRVAHPGGGGTGWVVENTPSVMSTGRAAQALDEVERRRRELHGAFGNDAFGRLAEGAARFFGTPQYIVGQTVAVVAWVLLNSTQLHLGFAWDVYPFIALNLLFSLQAAYAAPLILLAQTRQADRDKMQADRLEKSHSRLERAAKVETDKILELLQANTDLTQQDKELTQQVHALLTREKG
jgi:uncharacterized membrane protein